MTRSTELDGVGTVSEGEEPNRRVVIVPRPSADRDRRRRAGPPRQADHAPATAAGRDASRGRASSERQRRRRGRSEGSAEPADDEPGGEDTDPTRLSVDPAVRARLLDVLSRAQVLGFIGPGDVEAHLVHAEAFAGAVADPPDGRSTSAPAAAFPGLVLAAGLARLGVGAARRLRASRPRSSASVVAELGWSDRVVVRRDRAEEAGRDPDLRGRFDLVVARAFGRPAVTAECAAPLPAGGRTAAGERAAASTRRGPMAGRPAGRARAGAGGTVGPHRTARHHPGPSSRPARARPRIPRRVGVPAKRPLWRDVSRETSEP